MVPFGVDGAGGGSEEFARCRARGSGHPGNLPELVMRRVGTALVGCAASGVVRSADGVPGVRMGVSVAQQP